MHGPEIHAAVRHLVATGLSDTEIARRLSLSRSTVRGMRAPRRPVRARCPRCWLPAKPLAIGPAEYAYALGLYLGDGCISKLVRTYSLRLSLDVKYPEIVEEAKAALAGCTAGGKVSEHLAGPTRRTVVLCAYGNHLPCLFPQHGPGKKHEREIVLEQWQEALVAAEPWPLLRALIQTDGCRFVNPTGKYAYPSYEFSQYSTDIRRVFTDACDRVGVTHTQYKHRTRICTRAGVELLDRYIGPKR